MAVSLTLDQLATALRLNEDSSLRSDVERLLVMATAIVERYAPLAPPTVQNQAVVAIVGYALDAPVTGGVRQVQPSYLRLSGAAALLAQWRGHRLGAAGEALAGAGGSGGGGGGGASQVELDTLRATVNAALARIAALEGVTQLPSTTLIQVEHEDVGAAGQKLTFDRADGTELEVAIRNQRSGADDPVVGGSVSGQELTLSRASGGAIDIDLPVSSGVVDVTGEALPAPAAGQLGKVLTDAVHRVAYFLTEERVEAAVPVAAFTEYMASRYQGAFVSDTAARSSFNEVPGDLNKFYFNRHNHVIRVWDRITVGSGQSYYFRGIPGNGVAEFLAESENYNHSPADFEVFWLGYGGTEAELVQRLPDSESGFTDWRAYGYVEGTGLRRLRKQDFTSGTAYQDVYSWAPLAVPGVTAASPADLASLAARVDTLESAPASGGGGLDWRVISQYGADSAGYIANNANPPVNLGVAATADGWTSDKYRYLAARNEGESTSHRMLVPTDAEVIHVTLGSTALASALFFVQDLPAGTYNSAGDFGLNIPYSRGLGSGGASSSLFFVARIAMTAAREFLIDWHIDGYHSFSGTPPQNSGFTRVTVRVA